MAQYFHTDLCRIHKVHNRNKTSIFNYILQGKRMYAHGKDLKPPKFKPLLMCNTTFQTRTYFRLFLLFDSFLDAVL